MGARTLTSTSGRGTTSPPHPRLARPRPHRRSSAGRAVGLDEGERFRIQPSTTGPRRRRPRSSRPRQRGQGQEGRRFRPRRCRGSQHSQQERFSSVKSRGAVHKSLAKKALMGSISMHAGMSGLGDSDAIAPPPPRRSQRRLRVRPPVAHGVFQELQQANEENDGGQVVQVEVVVQRRSQQAVIAGGVPPASPKHTIVEGESFKAAKEIWDKASDSDSDASTRANRAAHTS